MSTKPKLSNLSYESIINYYLDVLPPDPQVRPLVDQQTPTLEEGVRSMTVFKAENQESYD